MSAPHPFALPGGDADLVMAEREVVELTAASDALLKIEDPSECDDEGYPLGWQDLRDEVSAFDELIHQRPAATLAGAAVKLRRLLDPDIGLPMCCAMDFHRKSLRDILAVIERESAKPAR